MLLDQGPISSCWNVLGDARGFVKLSEIRNLMFTSRKAKVIPGYYWGKQLTLALRHIYAAQRPLVPHMLRKCERANIRLS